MLAGFEDKLLRNEPMSKYTAARLGGTADWVYIARESAEELIAIVTTAWHEGMPVRVIGGGANVLVSDHGVRGLVIVDRLSEVSYDDCLATVSGGHSLTVLAHKLQSRGLSGFEWAVSVPGTVGGAVVNNAGAHKGDMAANVREVQIVDAERGAYTLTHAELGYDYRTSRLKTRTDRRFLVVSAVLAFSAGDSDAIKMQMDENIAHRKRTQPPGASLGSIFKNPPGDFAGRLIESCGLKGYAIGGAQVSPIHANFFINTGFTTAGDYAALIRYVRATVETMTGVLLEPEIELVGDWTDGLE